MQTSPPTYYKNISSDVVTLQSLNLIKRTEGDFRLINKVCSKWESFGILLGIPYEVLSGWRKECGTRRCWNTVMDHWLSIGGTPDYRPTWKGLYKLLKDGECTEIAKQLKAVVES